MEDLPAPDEIRLSMASLDRLMPMHVIIDPRERILHAGPTLIKACGGDDLAGKPFFEVFDARRTRPRANLLDACARYGRKIYLRMRDEYRTSLVGAACVLPGGETGLVNLSFGIALVDAVGRYDLAGSDFAASDLTLELLYLVEANSAAQRESALLTERLNGARRAAEADAGSDMLTGLRNRRVLDQVLERLISRNLPFALMHLDLDFFKAVNDTLGHAAGDLVLKRVAQILSEEVRDQDTVARVGGDEFVLVFDHLTDRTKLARIARRVIARLEEPVAYRDTTARISGSIGIICSTDLDRPEAGQMMELADAALYASKEKGRACYSFYEPGMKLAQRPEAAMDADGDGQAGGVAASPGAGGDDARRGRDLTARL